MSRIYIIERLTGKDVTAYVKSISVKDGNIRVHDMFGTDITDYIVFATEEDQPQEPAPVKKATKKGPRQFKGYQATGEKVKVCFNGWDGKSYNGESEVLPVYKADVCYDKTAIYVPKYSPKWGWTMHEVEVNWPKTGRDGDAYQVSFAQEVEVIK